MSRGQCHASSCVVVTWAVLYMQTRKCHEGSVTHPAVWLSHGQCCTCRHVNVTRAVSRIQLCGCHTCSCVVVTWAGTVDSMSLYSIIGVTRLSCGCHVCIDCFFCRSEPDISPRAKSPVSGSREPANDETDSVTSDIPTRSMSSPASYLSVDILRAEVEGVS